MLLVLFLRSVFVTSLFASCLPPLMLHPLLLRPPCLFLSFFLCTVFPLSLCLSLALFSGYRIIGLRVRVGVRWTMRQRLASKVHSTVHKRRRWRWCVGAEVRDGRGGGFSLSCNSVSRPPLCLRHPLSKEWYGPASVCEFAALPCQAFGRVRPRRNANSQS